MNAQRFRGDADGESCLVDTADDGTPLLGLIGWECATCASLYADQDAAERCCTPQADPVGTT